MVELRPLKGPETMSGAAEGVGGAGTAEPSRARRVWEVPFEKTDKTEKLPPRSSFGEMKEDMAGAEVDHVWTFEARISWDDFMCVILFLERGQLRGV